MIGILAATVLVFTSQDNVIEIPSLENTNAGVLMNTAIKLVQEKLTTIAQKN